MDHERRTRVRTLEPAGFSEPIFPELYPPKYLVAHNPKLEIFHGINRKKVTKFKLRLPPRSQMIWAMHYGASMICWACSAAILAFYAIFSRIHGSALDMGIVGWILVPLMLMGAEYILLWAIPKHFTRRKSGEAGGPLAMKPT
jgi:hypothetical protein